MPLIPDQPPHFELVPTSRSRNRVRVVCLGGGTGLSMILRGVKRISNVTAVVTTTDDGGSSGRLRRDFGMPAPGDVRHCLSALAEDESLVNQLFEHRFTDGELAGHSFGNLFLAGLTDLLGSFDQAVSESARVLAVVGAGRAQHHRHGRAGGRDGGRAHRARRDRDRGRRLIDPDACGWIRPTPPPTRARCRRSSGPT